MMGSRKRQRKPYHLQFSKAGHFTRRKPSPDPMRLRIADVLRKADQQHLSQHRAEAVDPEQARLPDDLGAEILTSAAAAGEAPCEE